MIEYLTVLIQLTRQRRARPTEEGFTTIEYLIILGIVVAAATALGVWYSGVLSGHEASIK